MRKPLIYSVRLSVLNFWLLLLFAMMLVPASGFVTTAEAGYRAHAESLLAQPPAGAVVAEDVEAAILATLNAYRRSKGRKPLAAADGDLLLAARAHALDLVALGKVGHVSSTGQGFDSRIRALKGGGLLVLPVMAENAARDRRKGVSRAEKAQALMQQWIDSPRHRKNLTDRSYVSVATGAVLAGDTVYAVQIFVGPEVKTNLFSSPQ
jgi:uncharacterized protein YkwD